MNIPNSLSVMRMCLIPFFMWVYLNADNSMEFYVAAGILIVSGITDILDGIIARKFNMITKLGKILDPLADKLTQAAVSVCLIIKIPYLWWLVVIFIIKELLMAVGGYKLFKKHQEIAAAKWFGKLYTVVFYLITVGIVAFPNLNKTLVFVLLTVVAIFTIFSFVMYIPVFIRLNKNGG